jgi:hypothetical protein
MGLFSKLKKLRFKDIGTGKNLKKIGQGVKQMKFGEGLGLLGLGFGGAGLFGAGPLGGQLGGVGAKLFGSQGIDTGMEMMEGFTPGLLNSPEAMDFYKNQAQGMLGRVMPGGQMPSQMMNMPQLQNMMPTAGLQMQENFQSAVNPNYIGQTYENPMARQQAGGYQDSLLSLFNNVQ